MNNLIQIAKISKKLLVHLAFSCLVFSLVACGGGGNSSPDSYTVTFESNGGSAVESQTITAGELATRPENPTKEGLGFVNWYSDDTLLTVYDFSQTVTADTTLYAKWEHELKAVIDSGTVPSDLTIYNNLTQSVLKPYTAGATLNALFVKQGSTGDGSSWDSAFSDLKTALDSNSISNASASNIYLILVSSATYKPSATLAMKNNVAIIGGWDADNWQYSGDTILDGDNNKRLFYHRDLNLDKTALLYGVTITKGSTPANENGGGMYNYDRSSPTLTNIVFSSNSATSYGGGMYNSYSSPTLTNIVFSSNSATLGGGMYNLASSSVLTSVVFSSNSAIKGGGMFNDNNGGTAPTLINSIFWANHKTGDTTATANQQIYMNNDIYGAENLNIYNSVVQHGIAHDGSGGIGRNADPAPAGSEVAINITSSGIITGDPLFSTLADNGGLIQTMSIGENSSAINEGLFVRKSGDNYYYSEDNSIWFTDPKNPTTTTSLPEGAEDITATDARGYTRNGRPDIGVYEYEGVAP